MHEKEVFVITSYSIHYTKLYDITKASLKEFIKKLGQDNSLYNNEESDVSEVDKSQVEYEVPRGIDHRVIVDKLITHCENELKEERFHNLLLDLSS